MKNIICLLILLGGSVNANAVVQTKRQSFPPIVMSATEIHDVIELLRFVRTAKPELFERFASSFEEVGSSCGNSALNENLADEFADLIEYIERELPETNGDLLGKIKLAVTFGGRHVYRPQFIEKENVRENISKFLLAVHHSYAGQNFEMCTQLIVRAQESRAIRVASAARI
jgi:hypothetical protein